MFGDSVVARRVLQIVLTAAFSTGAVACGGQEPPPDTTKGAQTSARYDSLANQESEIADWLSLRAAALTADSTARKSRYVHITIPAARDRIPWVEAQARERFGDTAGAIAAYTAIGAKVNTLRLRAATARTAADSQTIRRELLQYIANAGGSAVRDGYSLFDKIVRTPSAAEQFTIARAAAAAGYWARARTGYAASQSAAKWTAADRFSYATALAASNEDRKAAAQFAKITSPTRLAAAAGYQRGRSLVAAGDLRGATKALGAVIKRYPKDTSAAAALHLLADLATDDSNDANARTLLLQIAKQFPTSRYAPVAKFDAALIAFIRGDTRAAVTELASLSANPAELDAQYWLGRAQERGGDTSAARATWRALIARDSTSYYAALAAQRMNAHALHDLAGSDSYPTVPAVDSAARRIKLLRAMRMDPEVRYEAERLFRDAPANRNRLLATAATFAGTDQSSRAIALGRRALADYGATASIYRLLYPVTARDTIITESQANSIDPVLVTALIRQESNFNPSAISPVGARGLMQLMPSVASAIAKAKGLTPWSSERLYDPGTNIILGIAHLAPLLKHQPNTVRALAAYNAGESRIVRWSRRPGADDPEVFTERIPFAETREYVKSILRNRSMYEALYRWP